MALGQPPTTGPLSSSEAHMAFQNHVSELLEENGQYVDARALTSART